MPRRPISASLGMISSGKCEASSHSITCGRISPSANSRMDLRSCCCSDVKEKSKIRLLSEYIVSRIVGLSVAYGGREGQSIRHHHLCKSAMERTQIGRPEAQSDEDLRIATTVGSSNPRRGRKLTKEAGHP